MRRQEMARSGPKPDKSAVPVVLARDGTHGPVVHDINAAARRAGIRRLSRVTDVRAILPDVRIEQADLPQDEVDLAELSQWVRRWCPWSQVDGEDALLLDTTGTDHLYGGEKAMLTEMRAAFTALGLTIRIAIAPTIGAAWALARYGKNGSICDDSAIEQYLNPLPVEALRLDKQTTVLLRRLGLKTITMLTEVPRESLVRRFRHADRMEANPPLRLDQARGRMTELLRSAQIAPPVRVVHRLAEPVGDLDGLLHVLDLVLPPLCRLMQTAGRGARTLCFTAYRVDGRIQWIEARTGHASRDPLHLARLFDGMLDRIDPGFGIEAVALESVVHEALAEVQDDLTGRMREAVGLTQLLDKLSMRLGPERVLQAVRCGSHLPERGEKLVPLSSVAPTEDRAVNRLPTTPLRLLYRPEEAEVVHAVPDGPPALFRWRRKLHDVARSTGPERIAPEWWREKSTARLRDYYHVESREGIRFWLFREGVAGDGRGSHPRWFVHGLDA